MTSVEDFVVRVHMADDSDVMETDLAHVGIDGTVIRRHVGPYGMINSISQFFSSYTDYLTVLSNNLFWMGTGECGMMYTSSLTQYK